MTGHEKATSLELAGRPEVTLSQQKYHSIIHLQKRPDKLFFHMDRVRLAVKIARKHKEVNMTINRVDQTALDLINLQFSVIPKNGDKKATISWKEFQTRIMTTSEALILKKSQ